MLFSLMQTYSNIMREWLTLYIKINFWNDHATVIGWIIYTDEMILTCLIFKIIYDVQIKNKKWNDNKIHVYIFGYWFEDNSGE